MNLKSPQNENENEKDEKVMPNLQTKAFPYYYYDWIAEFIVRIIHDPYGEQVMTMDVCICKSKSAESIP